MVGCDSLHNFSFDAYILIRVDSHPTLEHISKFIVGEVAVDWKDAATFLAVISAAEADDPNMNTRVHL